VPSTHQAPSTQHPAATASPGWRISPLDSLTQRSCVRKQLSYSTNIDDCSRGTSGFFSVSCVVKGDNLPSNLPSLLYSRISKPPFLFPGHALPSPYGVTRAAYKPRKQPKSNPSDPQRPGSVAGRVTHTIQIRSPLSAFSLTFGPQKYCRVFPFLSSHFQSPRRCAHERC
jgi:hypothetical protein